MTAEQNEAEGPSLDEVLGDTGLTMRQVGYWVRKGHVKPARKPSKRGRVGSGIPYCWDEAELLVLRRMGYLVAAGFTPAAAARIARLSWPLCEVHERITVVVSDA